MSKTIITKVDSFFQDGGKKMNAAKVLDHEGMMDEHMESMFKPTGHKVDVGKRLLGNQDDLNLQVKAYEGKKVSRAQLQ